VDLFHFSLDSLGPSFSPHTPKLLPLPLSKPLVDDGGWHFSSISLHGNVFNE